MNDALPWLFAVGACGALGGALVALWASFRAAFGGAVPIELSSDVDHDARVRLLEEKESLLKNLADLRFDHDAGKISDADFERLDGKLRERTKTVLRLLDADVEPFRAEAERLIAERLGGAPRDPFREVAPEKRESKSKSKTGARSSEEVTTKKEKKEVREAVLAAQDDLVAASKPTPEGRGDERTAERAEGRKDEPKDAPKDERQDETGARTKTCPSCSTSNDFDAVFCKKCGHRFEANEMGASTDGEGEASPAKGAEEER